MQRSLPRWKWRAFHLTMLCCFITIIGNSQLNYNYTIPSGTTYAYNASPTVLLAGGTDDDLSTEISLGFTFQFGSNLYTSFKASSNGWLSIGGAATAHANNNDITSIAQGPVIAPLWDDLAVDGSGSVNYKLTGTAPNRVMTIEWKYMHWNYNSNNIVMSFQVKLYEATNVIEFWYKREGGNVNSGSASIGLNGGSSSSDFYSVNGSGVAIYGTATNNFNVRPATNQVYRWTPANMQYLSSTTTQNNTSSISKCNNLNQQIIGIEVVTSGQYNPITLTQFLINMNGSSIIGTSTTDVTGIHIYYTGTASAFAPVNEFSGGTIPVAFGTITVNGSQTLQTGTNYFWIAYDINATTGTVGNVVDGRCGQLTVAGFPRIPSVTNNAGSRTIADCSTGPGGITNASFWVKANAGLPGGTANNTKIGSWADQSGNGRNATTSNTNNYPTYLDNTTRNLNFNPTIDFDEASQSAANADFMDITANGVLSPANNPYQVYAVIVPGIKNLTTPGKFLFAGEAGLNKFNSFDVRSNYSINDSWNMNDLIVQNVWAVDSICMLTFDFNSDRRAAFKQGTLVGSMTSEARFTANLNNALGYQKTANLEYYDGGIAEIITYSNTSHGTTTREKVESYLGIKYGATLGHNYLASDGTIVWNRSSNAAYNNNIIGLAQDNTSTLLQKQARSTTGRPDILTMHIGSSLVTNQANNNGTFASGDRSFFMVGHNNDYPLNLGTGERPAGICCRISREWLVQQTNFTNTDVKLIFDFNYYTSGYITLNAADLRLLVDADGDFNNATILTTPTIVANAGVVTVTVPASAFNGTPYFSLGSVSMNTILPLELSSFTGVCRNDVTQLKWATATPAVNDFVVERSTDKTNFAAVATVKKAIGDQYSWSDGAPAAGTVYYRLKSANAQGAPQYSQIIAVASCNSKSVQLSTNPVTNASTLLLQLPQNVQMEISLFDVMGRRFEVASLTGKKSYSRGTYSLPVNIPGTVAGLYTLHVLVNGERHVFRIIKK